MQEKPVNNKKLLNLMNELIELLNAVDMEENGKPLYFYCECSPHIQNKLKHRGIMANQVNSRRATFEGVKEIIDRIHEMPEPVVDWLIQLLEGIHKDVYQPKIETAYPPAKML